MSKKLLSWVLAASSMLVFLSTVTFFIYWTLTKASWWLCDLSSTAVFVEGMAVLFWGTDKWDIVRSLNKLFRWFDLSLVDTLYLTELESAKSDLAYAQYCANQAEQELEERQSEQGALKVKIALLNLRYEAEAIGYQVHWIKEGKGEPFSLIAGDEPLPFAQTLHDIEHALEIVLHDAAAIAPAKSEVTR